MWYVGGCAALAGLGIVCVVGFVLIQIARVSADLRESMTPPAGPRLSREERDLVAREYQPLVARVRQVSQAASGGTPTDFRAELVDTWGAKYPDLLYVNWPGNGWGTVDYERLRTHGGPVARGVLSTVDDVEIPVVAFSEGGTRADGTDWEFTVIVRDRSQSMSDAARKAGAGVAVSADMRDRVIAEYQPLSDRVRPCACYTGGAEQASLMTELGSTWSAKYPDLVMVTFGHAMWTRGFEWKGHSLPPGRVVRGAVRVPDDREIPVLMIKDEGIAADGRAWGYVIAIRDGETRPRTPEPWEHSKPSADH